MTATVRGNDGMTGLRSAVVAHHDPVIAGGSRLTSDHLTLALVAELGADHDPGGSLPVH